MPIDRETIEKNLRLHVDRLAGLSGPDLSRGQRTLPPWSVHGHACSDLRCCPGRRSVNTALHSGVFSDRWSTMYPVARWEVKKRSGGGAEYRGEWAVWFV
ncbi:hypothetical protein FYK55_28750 [Roseiconus nitratireducens]|uniref:Uncharacterized protein n=1 Tax=Roseiconus nitratireducens TaxID=2605748 RepID=A0A5M6CG07_9BACT|nr:hypothetical protein FYK55_28750 [Roseiconus nitratireducens]